MARKARNDLHHSGAHPTAADARTAYDGTTGPLIVAPDGESPPFVDLDLADHSLALKSEEQQAAALVFCTRDLVVKQRAHLVRHRRS